MDFIKLSGTTPQALINEVDSARMTHFEDSLKPHIWTETRPHVRQVAVNRIRCWDEWTPANELWRDLFGSFELASGSVSARSGEGAASWSLHGMVISLACSLPMYLLPNRTDTGLRHTLLGSSVTRDPWSGRLPVSSLLPGTFSDPWTPNVAQPLEEQAGQLVASLPPALCTTSSVLLAISRAGSRPPWAGQQPLLTPAIKLKSYSPISRLWSVQSVAWWPLWRLWPQHMFCTHV